MGRWDMRGGYREVLQVGLPLVASMASTTVMQFTDRVFLGRHSLEDLAASLSASVVNFVFMAFFVGVATYVNVFVAQYTGAGRHERVGTALWQGVWLSLAAAAVMAALAEAGGPLFTLAGHEPEVLVREVAYYRILCWGSGLLILSTCLSTFYSGRGMTRPVALVNMVGAALNIPLDYALINGAWGLPELGIEGAGIATVVSWGATMAMFAALVFTRAHERHFKILSAWRPDRVVFARLLRFGLPSGAQFFLDIFGFSVFILLVGRLGNDALAASNLVFSLNHFTFMPMVGLHIATETLVGQAMGARTPDLAERSVTSAIHLCMAWAALLGMVFLLFPEQLAMLFRPTDFSPERFAPVVQASRNLLLFVVVYSFFDGLAIVQFGALKGAGDTHFVMWTSAACSLGLLVVPAYVTIEILHAGLYWAWGSVVAYLVVLATITRLRYKGGKWRAMSVIET